MLTQSWMPAQMRDFFEFQSQKKSWRKIFLASARCMPNFVTIVQCKLKARVLWVNKRHKKYKKKQMKIINNHVQLFRTSGHWNSTPAQLFLSIVSFRETVVNINWETSEWSQNEKVSSSGHGLSSAFNFKVLFQFNCVP